MLVIRFISSTQKPAKSWQFGNINRQPPPVGGGGNMEECYMIKLNKYIDGLYSTIEKIENKIEGLKQKKEAIEDNACDRDRDLTQKEWNTILDINDEIEVLTSEIDNIQNAIAYIEEYTD